MQTTVDVDHLAGGLGEPVAEQRHHVAALEARDPIEIKGKGKMQTYLVVGKAPPTTGLG